MSYDPLEDWSTLETFTIGVPVLAVILVPMAPVVKVVWNHLPVVGNITGKITGRQAWVFALITLVTFFAGAEIGAQEKREDQRAIRYTFHPRTW